MTTAEVRKLPEGSVVVRNSNAYYCNGQGSLRPEVTEVNPAPFTVVYVALAPSCADLGAEGFRTEPGP